MNQETKTTRILRCFGCGAVIQNTDPSLTGFLPKHILKEGEMPLCQRCYRLQHYGEEAPNNLFSHDFKKVLDTAKKQQCLILYVVDLFSFESSLIQSAFEYFRSNPLIVIANKRDVLPKAVDDEKLRTFVANKLTSLDLHPIEILLASAYKNYNIDEIIAAVNTHRNRKDVYVVGASCVGKSSLINSFLKVYKNETKNFISTSPYPGTTMNVIKVPLDKETTFYDTPGVVVENSIFAHVERNALKYIIPRREINPRTFQINDGQSIFIGGIARVDFVRGHKSGFTFYLSNEIDLHRTKLDRANAIFDSMIQAKKLKPISASLRTIEDFEAHVFDLPKDQPIDLILSGLGWVKVQGKGQQVRVYAPRGVEVFIRECKI